MGPGHTCTTLREIDLVRSVYACDCVKQKRNWKTREISKVSMLLKSVSWPPEQCDKKMKKSYIGSVYMSDFPVRFRSSFHNEIANKYSNCF
jgi:hypothetical protein